MKPDISNLSYKELLELQVAIHAAIRANIRARNALKAAETEARILKFSGSTDVQQRHPIDLVAERQEWLSRKSTGTL